MKYTRKGVAVVTEATVEGLNGDWEQANKPSDLARRIEEIRNEDPVIGQILMSAFFKDPARAHFAVFVYELVARQSESYKMNESFRM